MNEEEKEAIEYLKRNDIVEIEYDNYGLEYIHRIGINEKQILLNLIDKLQKENKVLEIIHETYKEVVDKGEFISKDKIRKIIYPSPDNMIPLEVQTSDMYMKLKDLVEDNK